MKGPLVSIIMPAFNAESYVGGAIRSVLDQTYLNWELVIVDDGSRDATADIARRHALTDERIRYISQNNGGVSQARNQGIKQSSGELIAFLDADDLWIREKLALQVSAMEKEKADIVFSNGFFFFDANEEDETSTFGRVNDEIGWGEVSGDLMFQRLFNGPSIPLLSVLTRKSVSGRTAQFDEGYRYCEDYDLWLRLAAEGADFFGLPDKLVRYRVHSKQASGNQIEMLRSELLVLKKHQGATLVSEQEKARRFRLLYQKLIGSLVDNQQINEARQYSRELWSRERFKPSTLARAALLELMPGSYKTILKFAHRAQSTLSFRVGRPLRHVWRSAMTRPQL